MGSETAGEGRRYRAFIAYSHRDRRWAAWLHRRLEGYRIPRRLVGRSAAAGRIPRRLTPIFRDLEELGTAGDLSERIETALAQSDALIVVCSPAAARSRWVNEEVLRFKRSGRGNRIFCLIVDGRPFVSGAHAGSEEECFAPALRYRLDARGESTSEIAEPLAADVRPEGDGRRTALLKLVAGLLGVELDELRRREQQRRNLRWATVTVLALVAMTATSLLALEATLQRRAAERRQKQAEQLVGFMLGNFSDKLRQLGRLDLVAKLDEQAMKYFESLPPADVDTQTLIQRAKALEEIGNTRQEQGDYGEALEASRAELAITSRLAKRYPRDAKRQDAWGENLVWLGFLYWNQGKLAEAEHAFTHAVAALQGAAALSPSDTEIQNHLAELLTNLGYLDEQRGELKQARLHYALFMQVSMNLAASDPGNPKWQSDLAYAYDNLGKLALRSGDFVAAIRNYQEENRTASENVRRHPSDQPIRLDLVFSDGILGRTLFLAGEWQTGVRYVRKAVRLADKLVEYDPTHTDWREGRAYFSAILARLLLEQGHADEAETFAKTSISDLHLLTSKDPSNQQWASDLALSQVTAALVAHARHDDDTATELAAAAAQSVSALRKAGTDTSSDALTATTASLLLANIAQANGDSSRAAALRKQGIAIIEPTLKPWANPRNLAAGVSARLAAQGTSGTKADIERLWRMGYRTPSFVAELRSHGIDYPANRDVTGKVAQLVHARQAAAADSAPAPAPDSSPPTTSQPGELQ